MYTRGKENKTPYRKQGRVAPYSIIGSEGHSEATLNQLIYMMPPWIETKQLIIAVHLKCETAVQEIINRMDCGKNGFTEIMD